MLQSDRFAPAHDHMAAEVIDQEAILIDFTTGAYYSMVEVAAGIWSLIERQSSRAEMIAAITRRYDVRDVDVEADVADLLDALLAEKLILPVAADVSSAEPSTELAAAALPAETTPRPYTRPTLSIFRDMSMLLALDPPLPGIQAAPWQTPKAMT